MRQQALQYFASAGVLSKASLVMALTNAALSVCAWLPFSEVLGDSIYPLHIVMILLMIAGFIRAGWRSLMEEFGGSGKSGASRLPALFRWGFAAAAVYFGVVFGGYAALSRPGMGLSAAAGLRIATAAYLLLSLCLFALAHAFDARRAASSASAR